MTSLEFMCPSCGASNNWTSSNYWTGAKGPEMGHCRGEGEDLLNRTCKFDWLRSEDWRYFMKVERTHFADEAEYEATRRTYGDA